MATGSCDPVSSMSPRQHSPTTVKNSQPKPSSTEDIRSVKTDPVQFKMALQAVPVLLLKMVVLQAVLSS